MIAQKWRCWLGALAGVASGVAAEPRGDFDAAVAAYDGRRYSEARAAFCRLAPASSPDADLDFYLGRLALWFDDGAEALARLEPAARRAPENARLQNALGDAYGLAAQNASFFAKLGWAEKCLAAYERAVALEPANPAWRWSLLGYYLVVPRIAGGGNRKACAQADEIRRLDPMGGRIAWATLHLAEKDYDAAFAQFDDVLRAEPDNFLALYHVGRCAALSGRQLDRGAAALQRCLDLPPPAGDGMPTLASVRYRLANIVEKKGDLAAARAGYAAVAREHPDFRPAKIALKN